MGYQLDSVLGFRNGELPILPTVADGLLEGYKDSALGLDMLVEFALFCIKLFHAPFEAKQHFGRQPTS